MLLEEGKIINCKYCGSDDINRCGAYKNVPRYLCKRCNRKFKIDQNVFYMRVPVEYIAKTLEMYYQGEKISAIKSTLQNEFHFTPSRAVLYRWIYTFTDRLLLYLNSYSPQTGDIWLIGEEIGKFAGQRWKIYDVVDLKSHFILAAYATPTRSLATIRTLYENAVQKAGKSPRIITIFMVYSFFDRAKKLFNCQVEHISMLPQDIPYNIELIENTIKSYEERRNLLRRARKPEVLQKMIQAWNVYHNFFKPQKMLHGQSPAEAAGIDHAPKSWKNLITHLSGRISM